MGILDRIKSRKPQVEITSEVVTGAYGGARARITPTNINSIFTQLPGQGLSGISTRAAARPNSAPMLKSSTWHTNIPGIGVLRGMPTTPFSRGTEDIHPAAVSDATHIRQHYGVHPTIRRKILRGNGSL